MPRERCRVGHGFIFVGFLIASLQAYVFLIATTNMNKVTIESSVGDKDPKSTVEPEQLENKLGHAMHVNANWSLALEHTKTGVPETNAEIDRLTREIEVLKKAQLSDDAGYPSIYRGLAKARDLRSNLAYGRKVCIVVFDSRRFIPETYWYATAYIWAQYAKVHNHELAIYGYAAGCNSCDGSPVGTSWCKVAAMLQALEDFPESTLFLYVDSDATISPNHMKTSLFDVFGDMGVMAPDTYKSFIVNQDGPGTWCFTRERAGYNGGLRDEDSHLLEHCLNSGTVIYKRDANSIAFLRDWWFLADAPVGSIDNPFTYRIRDEWPYDQGPLALAKELHRTAAMVVPHPQRRDMHWGNRKPGKEWPILPFCLSHVSGAKCYISHHCIDRNDKQKLVERALKLRVDLKEKNFSEASFFARELENPSSSSYCLKPLSGLSKIHMSNW